MVRFNFEQVAEEPISPEKLADKMGSIVREIQGAFDIQPDGSIGVISTSTLEDLAKDKKIERFHSWLPKFLQPGVVDNPDDLTVMQTLAVWLGSVGYGPRFGGGSGMSIEDRAIYAEMLRRQQEAMGERDAMAAGVPGSERGAYYGMQAMDVEQAMERFHTVFHDNPDEFLQHTLINTAIYGAAARIEGTEQYYVRYRSPLFKDRHRTLVDGHHMLVELGGKVFKSADYKHLYGEIQFNPEPKQFQELARFAVPVEITLQDGTIKRGEIGPADYNDVWERNPIVRAKDGKMYPIRDLLMSNNFNVVEEAGEGAILFEVLRNKLSYVDDPANPIVDTNLWIDKPMAGNPTQFEQDKIESIGELLQWTVGAYILSTPYTEVTLRRLYYDPYFHGAVNYEGRPAVLMENYNTLYSKYLYESRGINSWWYDFYSEFGDKLVPILAMRNKSAVFEMRKGMRDDDSRRELLNLPENECWVDLKAGLALDAEGNPTTAEGKRILKLREEGLNWLYYDNPLPAYLKPIQEAIALGQTVRLSGSIYPELKGLDITSLADRGIPATCVRTEKRKRNGYEETIYILDFSNTRFGRHFILQNRIPKGWLRGAQEIKELWQGMSDAEKNVFDGVPFKAALLAQEQDINTGAVNGRAALERLIDTHSVRYFLFENLAKTDVGKYFNYLARQKDNLAIVEACHLAMSLLAKPQDILPEKRLDISGNATAGYIGKQEEEQIKAFSGLTSQGFVPVPQDLKSRVFEETFVSSVINNIDIKGHPTIRYVPKVKGDSWDLVPTQERDITAAGRTADLLRKQLGFRVIKIGGKESVIGCGCARINKSTNPEDSSPMRDQFAGRRLHLRYLLDIMYYAGFDRQQLALNPEKSSVGIEIANWIWELAKHDIVIKGPEYTKIEEQFLTDNKLNPILYALGEAR